MSLPSGAIRLNWIQSTGTQYVNTGFNPSSKSRIVFDFQSIGSSSDTIKAMFGARLNNDTKCFNMFALPTTAYPQYGANAYNAKPITTDILQRTVYDMNANTTTVGSTTVSFAAETFSTGYPVYLFSLNDNGSPDSRYINGKLYGCQIYDNGVFVRNYIPVKLSDGSVGLWDDVEGKFYGNAGSGVFVAGPASEIVELEYIQSSGTQYIDTGFIPNQDTRVVAEMEYVSHTAATCALFGSGQAAHGEAFETFYLSGNYYFGFGSANYTAKANVTTGKKMLIDLAKDRAVYDIGGTVLNLTPTASQTFTGQYELLIHAMHRGGSKQYLSVSRTYSFQIYDNGLLVRDFIPAKTIEGEVGLYDRVFHEFYRNAGTGTFIAGPEMVHDGYTELEYVESTGTQYVDTLFMPNNNTRVTGDFEITENDSNFKGIFGAREGSLARCFSLFTKSLNPFYSNVGTKNDIYTFTTLPVVGRHFADSNKNVITIDGLSYTHTARTFQNSSTTIYLFANNEDGTASMFCKMKWFSCQIYDNGTVVRIYIPMLHPSGVPGLWDSVNERFYASATSTDLIAGPVKIATPKAPGNFRVVSESDAEVALAWDASANATGYRLYRNGVLLADTTDLAYTDTAEPFGTYTYTVSAYNEFGEGEAAELVVFLSPDNPILWLVTDRTQADVTAGNSKGVYQAVDLNRVGAAVEYLQKRLLSAGILADVSPRVDWTDTMWMSAGEAQVYLDNVKTMRAALAMPKGTPAAPDDLAKLTYAEANHMEMFLVILDTLLTDMVFAYRHCGVTTCGMGGLIL